MKALKPHLSTTREIAAFFLGASSIMQAMKAHDNGIYDDLVDKFRAVSEELKKDLPLAFP